MAQSNTRLTTSLQSISQAASLAVCAIGCLVMLGWILDIPALKSVFPGLVTMKTNAALGFILSGAALWLWHKEGKSEKRPQAEFSFASPDLGARQQQVNRNKFFILPFAFCLLPFVIGLLTLIEYQFGVDFGIDQLLFKEPPNAIGTLAPNRMAPNTALDFILLGGAMLLMQTRGYRYHVAQLLSLVAFLVAWLGFLGYIYNIKEFYGIATYTRMALHTAIAFILLSISILFACPDKGLMAIVTSNSAGGIMARRLSLAVVVIPPFLSWIIIKGYRQQQYDSDFGLAIAGVMNLVIFSILIWCNAKSLNAIDERRQKAEEELRSLNAELEQRVSDRTLELSRSNEQLASEIAERKQTEEALIESEKRFRQIATNLREIFWMIDVDSQQMLYVSPAYEEIWGRTRQSLYEQRESFLDTIYAEDRPRIIAAFEKLIPEDYDEEYRILRPDGGQRWIRDRAFPVRNEHGQIYRIVGIAEDITQRKQTEERLRLLESVVVHANDAVLISEAEPIDNPGPRIIYANAAFTRMTGYNLEEVIEQTPRILQGPKTDRQSLDKIRVALQNLEPVVVELINYRKDGSEFWVELSIVPVADETGNYTHWISLQRDISERKQALEALQKAALELEIRVGERTAELAKANADLQLQIAIAEQAEASLNEITRLQRAILNSANYSIISTNVDGTILTFNRAAERWLGYAAAEVVGKTTPALFHDKDQIAKRAQELSQELKVTIEPGFEVFVAKARQGEPDERQWTYIRKDGTRFPILLSVTAVRDGEGNITGFMGIASDISDCIEAEKALRDSERRFRAIFNQTFQFIGLLNPDGTVLEVNQPALEAGGLKHSDVVGRRVWDAGWKFTPEDRQLWLSAITEAAQGKFARFEVHLPFGEDINLTIDTSVKPVKDETEQVVFLIAEGRDISDRKRAEEALYQSQQQLQAILDNSPAVIYVIDVQNRYLLINRKFQNLFNRNREPLIGKSIYHTWPQNIADKFVANNRQVIETDAPLETEEIVLQDNEIHTYLSIKFPLYNSSGVPYAVCGISTDITERKQAEEALKKAHDELEIRVQERTAALAQVNNELRTEIVERLLTEQALRQSEERYRSLVVATAQNVWTTDPSGLVVSDLPLWRAITGQTEVEIQGWGWLEALHPGDREQTAQLWMQAIETKSLYETEYRVRLHDGNYGYFFCRGVPVLEADGSIREWVGIHHDITSRKLAEEALKESEARLLAILDNSPTVIYLKDTQGRFILINRQFEMLFHVDREQVKGKNDYDLFPEEMAEVFQRNDRQVLEAGSPQMWEEVAPQDDGMHTYTSIKFPLCDASGVPYALCGISIDISDRKQAEELVKRSAAEITQIFDMLPSFVWKFCPASRQFIYASGVVTEISGISRDAFFENYQVWDDRVDSGYESLEALKIAWEAINKGEPYRVVYLFHTFHKGARWFEIIGRPAYEDGVLYYYGSTTDITERKQAEEALRESESRFRRVVDSNMIGIIFWKVNGNITEANDAFLEMVGYTREDLLSEKVNWIHITPAEYIHLDEKGIQEMAANGVCTPFEKEYIRKDGSRIPVLVGGAILEGHEDTGVCFVIDISDAVAAATQRKRMEHELAEQAKELARSNADLAQFAYVASHDLQEPLRMVASYTQLLSRRYKGKLDEDADEFIAFAVDGANRMQKLIKDLLEYSRIGTRGKQFAPVECESIFEDAIANLQIAIEESGAIVKRDALPTVWGDSTQLGQLLQNLIGNAIKFCGNPPPRIHVSAQKGENEWIFSVRDNGIGIEPDQRDRIFVIFQRLHSRAEYPGTGIGLALCKKIVERHGGQIWVQSQPGQGSVFHFTIPLTGVDVN
ncbi:PAS domain S-box protein [Microcoleus sp. FACHB-831]|uniref:PAS domain S-box protein n=1 Tax=Microcoleus sp. FACHB-831 TaxID=2692827 RepID=UPI0016823827|nr:PAS domain S-box protein [Microcoleus sp. FACHB-831]MBD1922960.1 PAS domain S-box protein [Microcoleus sp. FACHB-831]